VTGDIRLNDESVVVGGSGANGTVSVRGKDGQPLVELLGRDDEAVIGAGQTGRPGRLSMYNGAGQNTVNLTTADAALVLGGGGVGGTVSVRGKDGQPLVELLGRDDEAVIGLGQQSRPGRISLYDAKGAEAVRIDSSSGGDIQLSNGDVAEEFACSEGVPLRPGTLVVLAPDGSVKPCDQAYDTRVAGVIAGAGPYRPAIVLDRRSDRCGRSQVAVLGKVHCLADARARRVMAGDLLTTSDLPGHAMAVADRSQAVGAIVGKALAALEKGTGVIPVLITLQ
jgi:hypothetical protein